MYKRQGSNNQPLYWLVLAAKHQIATRFWKAATQLGKTQEQIAKVSFGVLTRALLLHQRDYLDVLRNHAVATPWMPTGADFVSQFQDPDREYVEHNQEGLAAPQISLPVQGAVVADSVIAARLLKDLVNAGSPQTTITLQLQWNILGARFTLDLDPATLPPERYRTLGFRVGQSTEAGNPPNRDQDFTIEVSSGSRTAAIAASSLNRLLYPDVVFGAGKIVMQTLRLPLKWLEERGVQLDDLRSIALVFDRRPTGIIYVGDVQVSD